jgi:DNA topoisomerase I
MRRGSQEANPAPARGLEVAPRTPVPTQTLRHVSDAMPGIRRERRGRGFVYRTSKGRLIHDAEELARIRALAIPPAYRNVWICPDPQGYLQATARDARGRKQYRYHPEWRSHREETKFGRLLAFGRALPRIRKRVAADLRKAGLPREKVLATIVRLLERTLVRVGNAEYSRANGSFGLTTLRDRHAQVRRDTIVLEFKGKSGKAHRVQVDDPLAARIVKRCRDLPGQELFQWVDSDGTRRTVGSSDVNDYLREAAGGEFTAKDYRTWFGSLYALEQLCGEPPASQTAAKRKVLGVMRHVAERLGNTATVCRKSYVHPMIIERYVAGDLANLEDESSERRLRVLLRSCESKRRRAPSRSRKNGRARASPRVPEWRETRATM